MKNLKLISIFLFLSLVTNVNSQINGYAKVTAYNAVTKMLSINNVNQNYGSFVINQKILIYHVQGNVSPTLTNTSNYGLVNTILNTGRVEMATIKNITYSGGLPISIEVTKELTYAPDFSANSSIQVVTYPEFNNYTTLNKIVPVPWDGAVGGVIAFHVKGVLTLNHSIEADGCGFRGGAKSVINGDACTSNTYFSSSNTFASKGEGIYKPSNNNHLYAMGSLANGGGGGNPHNAGGGGGGNFSAGGEGGYGWQCGVNVGGKGGRSLSAEVTNDVVIAYFGGAGGGAHQNNGFGSNGSNGGGLIFIQADTILVKNPLLKISANGASAGNSNGNDGAGGGGAGGSVILKTNEVNVLTSDGASLSIEANGGNGGNVIDRNSHGGGGGGGTGLIKYIGADLSSVPGVTLFSLPGSKGLVDNTASPRATAQSGINTPGIIAYSGSVSLPVEMLEQKVKCTSTGAIITWATASETNNDYFQIEKTADFKEWKFVNVVKGTGNSNTINKYELQDDELGETQTYYRIKQVDYNGKFEYFDVLSILCKLGNGALEIIGINASDSHLNVYIKTDGLKPVKASLYDMNGKLLSVSEMQEPITGANFVQLSGNIVNGIYIVSIEQNNTKVSKKIMIGKN